MTKNYRESTPPETLERINETSIEIGKLLADQPQWYVDAFEIVARRELVEVTDSIRHPDIIRQLDLIDHSLDTMDRTRREIIRSRI
jgi:hypothetical protein